MKLKSMITPIVDYRCEEGASERSEASAVYSYQNSDGFSTIKSVDTKTPIYYEFRRNSTN